MPKVTKLARGPRLEIQVQERHVEGAGVYVKVYGEMKIGAKERVYARDLGLKTIQLLMLQPEHGTHNAYTTGVWIYRKGELDNYASIDIFSMASNEMLSAAAVTGLSAATSLPYDGSLWLGFIALGE